jgi:hypothetical protein
VGREAAETALRLRQVQKLIRDSGDILQSAGVFEALVSYAEQLQEALPTNHLPRK